MTNLAKQLQCYVAFRSFGVSDTCTNSQDGVRCKGLGIAIVALVDRDGCPHIGTFCDEHHAKLLKVIRNETRIEEFP